MDTMTNAAFSQIGAYIVIFMGVILVFFFNWVVNRIKLLVLCMMAVMDGLKELGVNGEVKKRFDALREQIVKD